MKTDKILPELIEAQNEAASAAGEMAAALNRFKESHQTAAQKLNLANSKISALLSILAS